MNTFIGALRMVAVVSVAIAGLVPVFITSLIPLEVKGARASLWVVVYLTRLFNLIFDVRAKCIGMDSICTHRGFIFTNHMSYLEALAIISMGPVRFLAAIEVRRRPVSGWMAERIGTIFVERQDKSSRAEARESIAKALLKSHYPPLVVFPEGRLGQGDNVLPFSIGAFEIATAHEIPFLVCATQYNQPEVVIWKGPRGERLASALWRLAKSRGKKFVDVKPLYVYSPKKEDDPKQLSRRARRAIGAELGLEKQIPI